MVLKGTDTTFTSDTTMNWIRMNTRLLASNSATSIWKQQWKVTFVDPEYKGPSVAEFIQDDLALNPKCYRVNAAFSTSFDGFAKDLIVDDARDEDQCREVREALGFHKDHPFDVEVRDSFHQHQCDPFFTGVDHYTEALSAPPKFQMVEYTPVEYEAVEYEGEKYLTVDYEEFSKGDDLGDLTETAWPDLYIPEPGLGDLTGIFDDTDQAENQDSLIALDLAHLKLSQALQAAEHVWDLTTNELDDVCDDTGESQICAGASLGIACFPNVPRLICSVSRKIGKKFAYYILVYTTIAFQAIDNEMAMATIDPNAEFYDYYYSRATYHNTKHYNEWNEKALDAIRLNMKDQHTEMKRQLQERHKDIANHVGQDIADSHNALGQAIVDAQNDIGQGIVDSQNALGQGIVDAQNALGQDIIDTSNYITVQHNVLSEWLYKNLCIIYKELGGHCAAAIGPLPENQAHIPMQLYWPKGKLNMMEKIDQLQTTLPIAVQDNLMLDYIENANVSSAGGQKTINDKIDALSSYVEDMQAKMDALSNGIESKVDALSNGIESKVDALSNGIESKVDASSNHLRDKVDAVENKMDVLVDGKVNDIEIKVDAVQVELKELKDMMTNLIGMMAN
eukprot:scaffold4251_cov37-Cyclotella_meneghiniana.AAC.5